MWRPRLRVRWLVVLLVLAAVATALLAMRTYRTFSMLESAYTAEMPQSSTVRPWMTIGYVARTYRVSEIALRGRLGLADDVPSDATLKALARARGLAPPGYVAIVQRAVAASAPSGDATDSSTGGWLQGTGEDSVSAVLVHGYPAIALTLMLGAIGVPLPSGLSTIVAGSLAAQGQMNWSLVAVVATASSVAGDVAGYGLGRALGADAIDRRGRWLGITADRRRRVERLLERWGALGVLLSRSLVSVLSSAVNLIAGAGRYRLASFVALALVARADRRLRAGAGRRPHVRITW
jgi:membrane protein DedA with SNARE-associated domain